MLADDFGTSELIGTALAWAANTAYVAARVPQILLNRRRGSVEVSRVGLERPSPPPRHRPASHLAFSTPHPHLMQGLSRLMFLCSVGGNGSYSLSILLRSTRTLPSPSPSP